ncbi:MAG: acetyl-CoA C-acyltransferase, partial [Chloroflexota bacterium]
MQASRQAVMVEGRRTPFCKAGTDLSELDVLELGRSAVVETLAQAGLSGVEIDQVVMGNVARPLKYHNIAREIGLAAGLPRTVPAFTVSLACCSSLLAATSAVDSIERGYAQTVVAGGVESLSNVPIQYSDRLARGLVGASKARSLGGKLESFAKVRLSDLAPVAPGIRETSTGLTMGESAEIMAKENGVSRRAQDELAVASHEKAVEAQTGCRLGEEVAPVYRRDGRAITADNHIRRDTTMDKIAALPAVFDQRHGTITAGNSSPLTDGASAVVLMAREKAEALGYLPLAQIRSYAQAAVDPSDQLLMAPAFAIPLALTRARLDLADVELFEMHEAFAAQVLSTIQALASSEFAREKLGRTRAVGE